MNNTGEAIIYLWNKPNMTSSKIAMFMPDNRMKNPLSIGNWSTDFSEDEGVVMQVYHNQG